MFARSARVITLFFLTSCSGTLFDSTPPQLKLTLTKLANNYLSQITLGNEKQFADMVYWPEFLGTGSSRITRDELDKQFRACFQRWSMYRENPNAHPLVGLKVSSLTSDDNYGEIRLKKSPPTPGEPLTEIRIKFIWEGTGWIIREDSLFGKDKYCSQYVGK
ncbi:MAG: hypothetical protein U0136_16735 [Bdellovibrionota bacterium]